MTHQRDDAPKVDAESPACGWTVGKVHIIMLHTVAALASARVPNLVLSYVFTHNAKATLSSLHTQPACIIADRQAGREAAVKDSGQTPAPMSAPRFLFIFCHRFDHELDFVLIPFLNTVLVLRSPPLDATAPAFRGTLLRLCERRRLRLRHHRRDPDHAERVDQTHIVVQHGCPFAMTSSRAATATVPRGCPP